MPEYVYIAQVPIVVTAGSKRVARKVAQRVADTLHGKVEGHDLTAGKYEGRVAEAGSSILKATGIEPSLSNCKGEVK